MEVIQQKVKEYPSAQQLSFALSLVNKKIKDGLIAKEYTYDMLTDHLIAIRFTPKWASKEFTIIYSYSFNNFERNVPKSIVNGLLDCKDEFTIHLIE